MKKDSYGPGNDRSRFGPGSVLNPVGLMSGDAAKSAISCGLASSLAGGRVAFTHCEILETGDSGEIHRRLSPVNDVGTGLSCLNGARGPFAGHCLSQPLVMGVVNVTPDSFSDGNEHMDAAKAIAWAADLIQAGAEILDIGGESTRPGAVPVGVQEECDRILPVVEATAAAGITVSVDTRHAETMRAAIAAGATIINDITAFTYDRAALRTVAETGASVILMHMQGKPESMQDNPCYGLASIDIYHWLKARIDACLEYGMSRDRIAIDPGIGFGKADKHNMEILNRMGMFHGLGCAVAVGVSRKSFIGRIADVETPKERLPGTLAATAIALSRGVQIHRVHDVAEIRQALSVWEAQYDNG
ncbi:MAG: dihydropteroate synthase [Pseudomonadota bacterium]|nr:dihydropteroate synthase [Pseudomonadota bacterium]